MNYEEHCCPYCATCKRYLDKAHEHIYKPNEENCVMCQHVKGEEVYHYDDFEKALGVSVSGLVKSSSGKVFIDKDYHTSGDWFPGFSQGFTLYSQSSYHEGKDYLVSYVFYYPEKNVLIIRHTYPSTQADNSCVEYMKYVAYIYTNFDIGSDSYSDIVNTVYQLARADTTVEYILDNYSGTIYKSSLEYYDTALNHDCYGDHSDSIRNYEVVEIDDCHTLNKSVCKNCERTVFATLKEHHTESYKIINKPSNLDESEYIPFCKTINYFEVECSKCGYKPNYALIVGSTYELGLDHNIDAIFLFGYYNDTNEEEYLNNDKFSFVSDHIFVDDKCLICNGEKLESSDLDNGYLLFDYDFFEEESNKWYVAQLVIDDDAYLFSMSYNSGTEFGAYTEDDEYWLEGEFNNTQIDMTLLYKGDQIAEFTYYIS